ncbi:hypothetical protein FDP41_005251 [Naegleria fowleri]|uniref:Nudix hydrolase domain-containing protein n=1 Tax=Naegleria fowleri TaxID=5763 RepID=A0A6A5BP97_NAEFO|nr:uncharacterized protein FDP41_005251 [Naegleria fowleri]KAF0975924.1 hypothetical protein FDP41_005251 [Naegleria fowleri]CAG4713579.1 unnamed protein product [Naegleria fowleri]
MSTNHDSSDHASSSSHHTKTYRNPSLTVDAIVPVRVHQSHNIDDEGSFHICLITRGRDPFKSCLAFPGGFVDYGEDPEIAVLRELEEETHLKVSETKTLEECRKNLQLITVAGNPQRDPRRHTVSVVYAVKLEGPYALRNLKADDDAESVSFYPLSSLVKGIEYELAFDHQMILEKFAKWFNDFGKDQEFYYEMEVDEHL